MGDRKWGREYKKLDLSVKFDVLFCYCRYMYDIDWEIYRKMYLSKGLEGAKVNFVFIFTSSA